MSESNTSTSTSSNSDHTSTTTEKAQSESVAGSQEQGTPQDSGVSEVLDSTTATLGEGDDDENFQPRAPIAHGVVKGGSKKGGTKK